MSSYDAHYKIPRENVFEVQEANELNDVIKPIPLLVQGQGTFIFKHSQRFNQTVEEGTLPTELLCVTFCSSNFSINTETGQKEYQPLFYLLIYDDREDTELTVSGAIVKSDKRGVIRSDYAFYWISLDFLHADADNDEMCIRFGRGEARVETEVFHYRVQVPKNSGYQQASQVLVSQYVQPMRMLRDPIVDKVPLVVKSTDCLTMVDVAGNTILPKATLSPVGQKLYDIVAGQNFVLDTTDFPHFSDAIKGSIESENGWCYKKLQEKADEFGPHSDEVYLRITLGKAGGESPGIPFVMEIWPPQCFSPIHQHAGANAIIRVLSGEIEVSLFPFLAKETSEGNQVAVTPFTKASFVKDQITWISPLLNQTHQLRNNAAKSGQPCITIQCYMYDETDTGHYPFFDYVDDDGSIHQFIPNSDMDFLEFKETMKREWEALVTAVKMS